MGVPILQLLQGESGVTIRIRNWSKHQHFKDRTPPWIKLYREILDDPDWHELSGDDAKLLVGLWLVASEDETRTGALPDPRKLAFRIRISEDELNQRLTRLSPWLERDDIAAISSRYQGDAPETETEAERETEEELESPNGDLSPAAPDDDAQGNGEQPSGRPPCPHVRIIALYHEILPELRQV